MTDSEAQIQAQIVRFMWNEHPETRGLFYHNYNNPKNAAHGATLKTLGLLPGVADLTLLWRGKAYFFELKDIKGRQSIAQQKWQWVVEEHNFNYHIIRSLEEFKMILVNII